MNAADQDLIKELETLVWRNDMIHQEVLTAYQTKREMDRHEILSLQLEREELEDTVRQLRAELAGPGMFHLVVFGKIREAIGDPYGKIMLSDLAKSVASRVTKADMWDTFKAHLWREAQGKNIDGKFLTNETSETAQTILDSMTWVVVWNRSFLAPGPFYDPTWTSDLHAAVQFQTNDEAIRAAGLSGGKAISFEEVLL